MVCFRGAGALMGKNNPTPKKTIKKLYILTVLLCCIALFPKTAQTDKTKLVYRLKWLFNTSVAGDIYALEKNFFKSQGLKVTLKEGSPEKNAIKELELGYADVGVASADQVIRALAKGADILVIAQLFQINPMQWIYRADRPEIRTLNDLKGRSIGITYGGNDETIMRTLLAKAYLTERDVTLTGVRFDFTPFYKRRVEIWPVYRNSQGVILEERLAREKETTLFLDPSAFGVNFVANSIITSGSMVKEHQKTVKKFLKALLQGWESAMAPENEDVALQVVKNRDSGNSDQIRKKQLAATRKLVKPSPMTAIGTIQVRAWTETEAIMLKLNQIKKPVAIQDRLIPPDEMNRNGLF